MNVKLRKAIIDEAVSRLQRADYSSLISPLVRSSIFGEGTEKTHATPLPTTSAALLELPTRSETEQNGRKVP